MVEYNLGHVTGTDGKGIGSIDKIDTTDNIDTYEIQYTNGDTQTYTVTNGVDGQSAPLTNNVTSTDISHAITPKGVYDYIQSVMGSLEADMLR
jgi:hypothetical protein